MLLNENSSLVILPKSYFNTDYNLTQYFRCVIMSGLEFQPKNLQG